jgi:hypothetical protein
MRSLLELGRIAMSSASALMQACGSILDDLHVQRPQGKLQGGLAGSPEWLADLSTVFCDAAAMAIRVQGVGFKVVIEPPACTTVTDPKPPCGSGVVLPHEQCAEPKVTIDPGTDASAERVALAKTLEKNLPVALGWKVRLEQVASLTGTIASKASSIATLESSCVPSFAQLATHSTSLVSSVSKSASTLVTAVQ